MNCPICEQRMKPVRHDWYRCDNCNHMSLDIGPDVNKEYQRTYTQRMRNHNNLNEYLQQRQKILEQRLQRIDDYLNNGDSVLDVGCGGGYMLDALRLEHEPLLGVELDPEMLWFCRELDIPCVEGDFLELAELDNFVRYDVVMSWHSLEHVVDINKFLDKLIRHTDKTLIIEVPVSRGIKHGDDYDGHPHSFSVESFKKLLKKHGLDGVTYMKGVQYPAILAVWRRQ